MKIIGLNLPENCTLSFHANGIKVGVSLNIGKNLLPHIAKNNVCKNKTCYTYFVTKDVPLYHCSAKNLEEMYWMLLNRAKQNVRIAKQKLLSAEVKQLQATQQSISWA